jgi:hypothetical protein
MTITYLISFLFDRLQYKQKKWKKRRENMIHNTYDAITTSEKNIKIDKSQKKFTGMKKKQKRYFLIFVLSFGTICCKVL